MDRRPGESPSAPFPACPYILITIAVLIAAVAAGNIFNVRRAMANAKINLTAHQ